VNIVFAANPDETNYGKNKIMKRTNIFEWLFFIACVSTLLLLAFFSASFVPLTAEGKVSVTLLQPRDTIYGAAQAGEGIPMVGGTDWLTIMPREPGAG